MKDQVEAMARKAGLIERTDDWASIPGEYKASLEVFGALLLEKAAKECDAKYRSLETARAHAEWSLGGASHLYFMQVMSAIAGCAESIRSLAREIRS